MTLNRRLLYRLCAAAALLALAAASAEAAPPVYRIIELEFPNDIGPYNSPEISP